MSERVRASDFHNRRSGSSHGNCRVLLAGPNPLGKLGGLATGQPVLAALTYFQTLGTAVEGTYTAQDKPAPKKLPLLKACGQANGGSRR